MLATRGSRKWRLAFKTTKHYPGFGIVRQESKIYGDCQWLVEHKPGTNSKNKKYVVKKETKKLRITDQ